MRIINEVNSFDPTGSLPLEKRGESNDFFAVLLLAACGKPENARRITQQQAVESAREAAQDAFNSLSTELAAAIAEGGPVHAIPVCSSKAGGLIQQVADRRQIKLIRLTDKPRNPKHLAKDADARAIDLFRTTLGQGGKPTPMVESSADQSLVVRIPITVSAPLCLQCHGRESEVSPETLAAIRQLYPDDKALGYQLGDLRGIWRIRLPVAD